jgi:4-hydroxy-tetrahydrodipicolinate synthase
MASRGVLACTSRRTSSLLRIDRRGPRWSASSWSASRGRAAGRPQMVQGYPAATLMRLCDEVPTIRAIKDWTPIVPQHETHVRMLQSRPRPVNVLSANSAWLMSSLALGGLLSGSGSVIADLQARLFRAVMSNDLTEARRLNDRIYPLAKAFYADPFVDMHNRMKEALALLGKLPRAVVRPPLVKIEGP